MPTLQLTDEQVIDLVKQLPSDRQRALYQYLLAQQWPAWAEGAEYASERARATAAQRDQDWDAMTEDERETLIDDLVHEDHQCSG